MTKTKIFTLLGISTLSALVLAACSNGSSSSSSSEGARDINYSIGANVQTLDSSMAADLVSIQTLMNVDSGLVRWDQNANVVNDLAQSINVSKDGLTYTVELRPNLKWSNGDALTAQDFVYGWQRTIDPKTGSEYAQALYPVANAAAINEGKMPVSSLGIKADGTRKLVITLAAPTPYFDKLMTETAFYPLNQKFVEKEGKAYGTTSDKTLYDGPYKFATGSKAWTGNNTTFSIVKNGDYWDEKAVKNPGVNYQVVTDPTAAVGLFKSGKTDVAQLSTPTLVNANKGNKDYKVLPAPKIDVLEYNQTGKVAALANQDIRAAINSAVNRQALIDTAAPNYTIVNTVTPSGLDKAPNGEDFAKYAAQPYNFDASKAATLFKEGMKKLGKTSLTLTLEGAADVPFQKTAADYLKANLEKELTGLTINENLVPKQQRQLDAQNGNFEIMLGGWSADYNEPSDFLMNFVTGSTSNDGRVSNSAFDAAYKAATTTPDILNADKRYADYKDAEAALYKSSNVLPLDTESAPLLINPSLKGISTTNASLIWIVRDAYIAK